MSAVTLEHRVGTLEYYMRELAYQSMRTEAELAQLSQEMREFKGEMRQFKDEMSQFKDEMSQFKDEMRDFKDEMRQFKDESRREAREMNRKWGDLANKMGTLVEDLVAPSLPRIVRETLGLEVIDLSIRRKRRLADGRTQEFDAIAVTETLVCLNSTKATLHSHHVEALVGEIALLREFFPEYRATPVVGILASLGVDDSVVRHASREGFLVLATGDQLMELRNPPGFVPGYR